MVTLFLCIFSCLSFFCKKVRNSFQEKTIDYREKSEETYLDSKQNAKFPNRIFLMTKKIYKQKERNSRHTIKREVEEKKRLGVDVNYDRS